jgi:hypothetical protein
VKSASFVECSLASFIYNFINNKTTKEIRHELLARYVSSDPLRFNDREYLSEGELRFLTYTSESLNRFLDKFVYQNSVYLTKPEILEDVP